MKTRVVVVDFGSAVHKRSDACPPFCHLCPHMKGAVMPYCFGSVCGHDDEFDLTHCTCSPADPVVAHLDLIARTATLQSLLLSKRRQRRDDRVRARRLLQLAQLMRWTTNQQGQAAAWQEVEQIAMTMAPAREVRE